MAILPVRYILPVLFACILAGGAAYPAHAHTTVTVGQYDIEVGWGTEPPVVGFRNTFVFEVSVPGEAEGVKSGVRDAFRSLDAEAKFGGITKKLDVSTDLHPGHYFSNVIPTRTGSITMLISGEIDGTPVDIEIPVEDVETTAVLDFPPRTNQGGADADLKNTVSALKEEIRRIDSGESQDTGAAYNFAVFGLSLGAAGVILAVVALLRK